MEVLWRPALNAALVAADIGRGYEEYLALVDSFYAEDIEVASEACLKAVVGSVNSKQH
jgi:hypothetical protein